MTGGWKDQSLGALARFFSTMRFTTYKWSASRRWWSPPYPHQYKKLFANLPPPPPHRFSGRKWRRERESCGCQIEQMTFQFIQRRGGFEAGGQHVPPPVRNGSFEVKHIALFLCPLSTNRKSQAPSRQAKPAEALSSESESTGARSRGGIAGRGGWRPPPQHRPGRVLSSEGETARKDAASARPRPAANQGRRWP